jgi:2-polyprenyl-3-methyl-5-hydroxy-6-metoxy-1,4-benzoquinol methylase
VGHPVGQHDDFAPPEVGGQSPETGNLRNVLSSPKATEKSAMREIACAVCGSTQRKVLYRDTLARAHMRDGHVDPYSAHYQINQCLRCALQYSSPIFDSNEVQLMYRESEQGNIVAGQEANVRRTMELYYELARPFLRGHTRVLDIGCDIGLILDIARLDGFRELYGIEPVTVAAVEAEQVPGARISTRFYEQEKFAAQYFDLVTLIHVVDHLVDPIQILTKAYAELRPGGVILAVVHNAGSPLARFLGERFPPYNLYHHYFFSKVSLRRLFKRAGFEVLRVTPTYNCYSLQFFVHKVPVLPMAFKKAGSDALNLVGLADRPLTLSIGNIGIIARRPLEL